MATSYRSPKESTQGSQPIQSVLQNSRHALSGRCIHPVTPLLIVDALSSVLMRAFETDYLGWKSQHSMFPLHTPRLVNPSGIQSHDVPLVALIEPPTSSEYCSVGYFLQA